MSLKSAQSKPEAAPAARASGRRYLGIPWDAVADMLWLTRDAARRFPAGIVGALAAQVTGQMLFAGALTQVVLYVRAVERGKHYALPKSIPIEMSGTTLALAAAGAALLLFGASASLSFWGRLISTRLVRRYEDTCAKACLEAVAIGSWPISDIGQPLTDRQLLRMLTKDVRYCGRAVDELIGAITPLFTMLISFATLVYLDWRLSLVLLLMTAVGAPAYMMVNRRGRKSMRAIERYASEDTLLKQELIGRSKIETSPAALSSHAAQELLDHDSHRHYLDGYEFRLRAAHSSIYVSNLLFATVFCVLLLYFGLLAPTAEGAGYSILAFVLAAQYFLVSVRGVAKSGANLSMFHESFCRVSRFLSRTQGTRRTAAATLGDSIRVTAEPLPGLESLGDIQVRRGSPVAVIANQPLTRMACTSVVGGGRGGGGRGGGGGGGAPEGSGMGIVTADYAPNAKSLRRSLWLDASASEPPSLPITPERQALLDRLKSPQDAPVTPSQWQEISPATRFLFACHALGRSGVDWIFLEQKAFRNLPDTDRDFVLRAAAAAFLVVFYPHVPDRLPPSQGAHFVVVVDGQVRRIAPGDSYAALRPQVLADFRTAPVHETLDDESQIVDDPDLV